MSSQLPAVLAKLELGCRPSSGRAGRGSPPQSPEDSGRRHFEKAAAPESEEDGCEQPCAPETGSVGTQHRSHGATGWVDLPHLPQALIVQRLTLWEAARLAPTSKNCAELCRSRQSPAQARLLRLLSAGSPPLNFLLLGMLGALVAAVSDRFKTANCPYGPSYKVGMHRCDAPLHFGSDSSIEIRVHTWPALTSRKNVSHVAGRESCCAISRTENGVSFKFHQGEQGKLRRDCWVCAWREDIFQRVSASESEGPSVRLLQRPKWRHADVVWLDIFAMDDWSFQLVLALLLAMLQRVASLPPVSRETENQGTGSGIRNSPQAPPGAVVFVFSNFQKSSVQAWEHPTTWEPLADSCDLHIVNPDLGLESAGWRETYFAIDALLGVGAKPRTRPMVLVCA